MMFQLTNVKVRRVLCVLIALFMVLSLVPATAFSAAEAEDALPYEGAAEPVTEEEAEAEETTEVEISPFNLIPAGVNLPLGTTIHNVTHGGTGAGGLRNHLGGGMRAIRLMNDIEVDGAAMAVSGTLHIFSNTSTTGEAFSITRTGGTARTFDVTGGNVHLHNVNVTRPTDIGVGGGVTVTGGHLHLHNGSMISNARHTVGGGVLISGGQATMHGGTIHGNTSTQNTQGSGGGGVLVTGGTTFTMTGGTISENRAFNTGGGVQVNNIGDTGTSRFNMSGGVIVGNLAMRNEDTANALGAGGGIHLNSSAIVALSGNAAVIENVAGATGGGIRLYGDSAASQLTITGNVRIANNVAGTNGGGISTRIAAHHINITEWSGEITGNIAGARNVGNPNVGGDGGGIHVQASGGRLTVGGTGSITNNTADNGGGIFTNVANLPATGAISANAIVVTAGITFDGNVARNGMRADEQMAQRNAINFAHEGSLRWMGVNPTAPTAPVWRDHIFNNADINVRPEAAHLRSVEYHVAGSAAANSEMTARLLSISNPLASGQLAINPVLTIPSGTITFVGSMVEYEVTRRPAHSELIGWSVNGGANQNADAMTFGPRAIASTTPSTAPDTTVVTIDAGDDLHIIYNANGGTNAPTQRVLYPGTHLLTVPPAGMTHPGVDGARVRFVGWSLAPQDVFEVGDRALWTPLLVTEVELIDEDVTVYAVWRFVDIIVDANYGPDGDTITVDVNLPDDRFEVELENNRIVVEVEDALVDEVIALEPGEGWRYEIRQVGDNVLVTFVTPPDAGYELERDPDSTIVIYTTVTFNAGTSGTFAAPTAPFALSEDAETDEETGNVTIVNLRVRRATVLAEEQVPTPIPDSEGRPFERWAPSEPAGHIVLTALTFVALYEGDIVVDANYSPDGEEVIVDVNLPDDEYEITVDEENNTIVVEIEDADEDDVVVSPPSDEWTYTIDQDGDNVIVTLIPPPEKGYELEQLPDGTVVIYITVTFDSGRHGTFAAPADEDEDDDDANDENGTPADEDDDAEEAENGGTDALNDDAATDEDDDDATNDDDDDANGDDDDVTNGDEDEVEDDDEDTNDTVTTTTLRVRRGTLIAEGQIPTPIPNEGFNFIGWAPSNPLTHQVLEVITFVAQYDSEEKARYAYMIGNEYGRFLPDDTLTRAEAATIMVRTQLRDFATVTNFFPPGMTSFVEFDDVHPSDWFFFYVAWAYEAEYVFGWDGSFRPNDPVTREELAAMLVRTGIVLPASISRTSFPDFANTSDWARGYVTDVYGLELMVGDALTGMFRPLHPIIRAETATAVNRLLGRIDSEDAWDAVEVENPEAIRSFPDVEEDDWFFGAVVAATNNHYLTRDSDGNIDWIQIIELDNGDNGSDNGDDEDAKLEDEDEDGEDDDEDEEDEEDDESEED